MDSLGEGRLPQSLGLGESRVAQSSFLPIAAGFMIVSGSLYLLTASWSPQHGIEAEPSTPANTMSAAGTETAVEVAWTQDAPAQAHTPEVQSESEAEVDDGDETLITGTAPAPQKFVEPTEPAPSSAQTAEATPTFGVAPIPEAEPIEAETIVSKSMAPADIPEIPALPDSAANETADPETPVAADRIGELIAESPTRLVSTQTISEDTGDVPDSPVDVSAAPSDSTDSADMAASSETAAPVAPHASKPEPKQKPSAVRETVRSTPAPRPAAQTQQQARPAPTQQVQTQPRNGLGFRLPMGLAPNKPVATSPAKPRVSGAAYSRKVWAALARSKPRAGQRGSATVVFTIGAGGSLGGARIARSSGNSRIDQLALATVRRAAPFPAPPSGGTSFSIRIDFQ